MLKPGESDVVEFIMFGSSNHKVNCLAVCCVEGGPEYKISLHGEASTVSFHLDKSSINFGEVLFVEKKDDEFYIINDGKVPFNFSIIMDPTSLFPGLIESVPSSGLIHPHEKLRILLRFRPAIPQKYTENIQIYVAHFDPVTLRCYGEGVYPSVTATLPRYKKVGPGGERGNVNYLWEQILNKAVVNLTCPDPYYIPPIDMGFSPPAMNSEIAPVYLSTYSATTTRLDSSRVAPIGSDLDSADADGASIGSNFKKVNTFYFKN